MPYYIPASQPILCLLQCLLKHDTVYRKVKLQGLCPHAPLHTCKPFTLYNAVQTVATAVHHLRKVRPTSLLLPEGGMLARKANSASWLADAAGAVSPCPTTYLQTLNALYFIAVQVASEASQAW